MGSRSPPLLSAASPRPAAMAACCDNLQVHSRDQAFSHSKYTGDFHLLEQEGELTTCNEAAVFTNDKGKLFIYRLNEGDWVVGTVLGNKKKGVWLRSQDPDREQYIHECPCQTQSWQKLEKESGKWVGDSTIRVLIRQAK